MRMNVSTTILRQLFIWGLAFLFVLLSGYSQSIPSLDEILKRAGANIQVFVETLPDFECRETARCRTIFNKGRPKEDTIESIIRYSSTHSEHREYKSINGKQVAKNWKEPKSFLHVRGIFGNVLGVFLPNSQKLNDYRIAGMETTQGRQALALTFGPIEGQKEPIGANNDNSSHVKNTGKAWLDLDSMQVIRIEIKMYNEHGDSIPATIVADYAKFNIAGKEFSMPKTITIKFEVSEKKGSCNWDYTADYTDYRKFDVSTEIKYSPMVQ